LGIRGMKKFENLNFLCILKCHPLASAAQGGPPPFRYTAQTRPQILIIQDMTQNVYYGL